MRSRHFYYAFLILDSLYGVCYYNVVGKIIYYLLCGGLIWINGNL